MTVQQSEALGRLITNWANGDLRAVTVTLRLSPSALDALPPGYIAGEIIRDEPTRSGDEMPRMVFAFGISPEGRVSS